MKLNFVPQKDLSSRNSPEATFHQRNLDLTDGEKFHTVVGIALNSVLIPGLKSYVDKKVEKHYKELVTKYRIDSENSTLDMATIGEKNLGLNIHEKNCKRVRRIANHHQLAKLYMKQFMAKFDKITDGKTDASAILSIMGNAGCFSKSEREGSLEVRSNIRNVWGHCNYEDWTEDMFLKCFHKMEKFIKNLSDTFIGRSEMQANLGNPSKYLEKKSVFKKTL